MSFDWQEEWENAAAEEYQHYSLATDEQLTAELQKKAWGSHYRIWDVIRDRGNIKMVWPLFEALQLLNESCYFHDRRHCTDAIFELLKIKNKPLHRRITGPSTSFDQAAFELALNELKKKIERKLT